MDVLNVLSPITNFCLFICLITPSKWTNAHNVYSKCLKEVLRFYIQFWVENGATCGMPAAHKALYLVLVVVEEKKPSELYVCYPFTYLGPEEGAVSTYTHPYKAECLYAKVTVV